MSKNFDYKILHHCEFELLDFHNNPFPCGEPATHKIWWRDDMRDAMLVCMEHFYMIYKREVKGE